MHKLLFPVDSKRNSELPAARASPFTGRARFRIRFAPRHGDSPPVIYHQRWAKPTDVPADLFEFREKWKSRLQCFGKGFNIFRCLIH